MKKIALALMLAASSPVFADSPFDQVGDGGKAAENVIKPYLVVGNYPEDRTRVFFFFSYTCPYCNQSWSGMEQWGRTLPQNFRFVGVPVITTEPSSKVAATSYYIVRYLAPNRLSEFNRLAYAVGQNGRDTDGQGYIRILYQMGFKAAEIERAANSPETEQRLRRAMILGKRYNVQMTPTFGVGGKYATHAGFTNGRYEVLVQLLNALVSQTIEQDMGRR